MENTIEKLAEENERRIVKFTNIDKENFTHSFRGVSITVKAKQSYIGRFPECDHLATHLARKMISRNKKETMGYDKDPKGSILYTEEEVNELKAKILEDVGNENAETLTPEKKREEDIKELKDKFPQPKTAKEPVSVTKEEVIKELKKRGVEPDIKKSKGELLEQLLALEAEGK